MAFTPTDSSEPVELPVDFYTTSAGPQSITDAAPWTSSVLQAVIDDAHADALSEAGAATDEAHAEALARPAVGPDPLVLTVDEAGKAPIDIQLDADGMLEALVLLYARDGWSGINDVGASIDREIARRFPADTWGSSLGEAFDAYGTPASALDPQNQTRDRSGYPSYYDVAGRPGALQSNEAVAVAERARWDEARGNFEHARQFMATSVAQALMHIEQLVTDLAVLGLNKSRDAAGAQRTRYGVDALKQAAAAKAGIGDPKKSGAEGSGTPAATGQQTQGESAAGRQAVNQDANLPSQSQGAPGSNQSQSGGKDATPAEPLDDHKARENAKQKRDSLTTLMRQLMAAKQDVEAADARYARALELQRRRQQTDQLATPYTDVGTPEEEFARRTVVHSGFENLLLQGRQEHPLCAPMLVSLKPDFHDDDLMGAIDDFTTTLISIAESFQPQSRMGELANDPSNLQRVLDNGPEIWLLDYIFAKIGFNPLTDEGMLAAVEDETSLEPFDIVVLENYRDALWKRVAAREGAQQAMEALGQWQLILATAGFFFPPAELAAEALGAVIMVSAAIEAVQSAIFLDASFAERAQAAMAQATGAGALADWHILGAVLRAQPQAIDYARALLHAGLSVAQAAGVIRNVPFPRLLILMALDAALDAG